MLSAIVMNNLSLIEKKYESRHKKTNNVAVAHRKTQISLISLLCPYEESFSP